MDRLVARPWTRAGATLLAALVAVTGAAMATSAAEQPPTDEAEAGVLDMRKKHKRKKPKAKLATTFIGEEIRAGAGSAWIVGVARCPDERGRSLDIARCKRGADLTGVRTDDDGDATVLATWGPLALVQAGTAEGFDVIALKNDRGQVLGSFGVTDGEVGEGKDLTGDSRVTHDDIFQVWFWTRIRGMAPDHPLWRPRLDFDGNGTIDADDLACIQAARDDGIKAFDAAAADRLFTPQTGPGSVADFTDLDWADPPEKPSIAQRLLKARWVPNETGVGPAALMVEDGTIRVIGDDEAARSFRARFDVDRDGGITPADLEELERIRTFDGAFDEPVDEIYEGDPGYEERADVTGNGIIDQADTDALDALLRSTEAPPLELATPVDAGS